MRARVGLLVLGLVAWGCDHEKSEVDARPATIPNPRIDRAAQKLDAGLAPAWRATVEGRWDEAIGVAEAYAGAHRGQAEFVVGMTYYRRMLYAEAVDHFLKAMELEPGYLETYFRAGYALMNVGRLGEARAALAVSAKYEPEEPSVAFGQGLVEIEADRVEAAEGFLKRAIELAEKKRGSREDAAIDADVGRYLARLGDVYMRKDEVGKARETFERAVAKRGDLPEIWSKLAAACERGGDVERAREARRKYEDLTRAAGPR